MSQHALPRPQYNYWLVFGDAAKDFKAVLFAPLGVRLSLVGPFKISKNIMFVKRVIYCFTSWLFGAVKPVSQGHINAATVNVFVYKRVKDYLITGDNDLLSLGQYQSIPIVTPREFYDRLL